MSSVAQPALLCRTLRFRCARFCGGGPVSVGAVTGEFISFAFRFNVACGVIGVEWTEPDAVFAGIGCEDGVTAEAGVPM